MITETRKAKWVAALRSGKYKQGHNQLYNKREDSYCCLGVYCKLFNIKSKNSLYIKKSNLNYTHIDMHAQQQFARLNDLDMKFNKIADTIERMSISTLRT